MGVFVAVHAFRKLQRLFEISFGVALDAVDLRMLAEKREFRLRMVELLILRYFLPPRSCVARLARLREGAMVRVVVAVAAFREGHSGKSRLTAGHFQSVAFFAGNLRVQSGERESRFAVIEFLRCFPIHKVVALKTVLSELSFVRVLMARIAILRKTLVRPIQILDFDLRALIFGDVGRVMALIAGHRCMLSLQSVARSRVIEFFERWFPVNQGKIFAVMFAVAFCAVFFIRKPRVEPLLAAQFRRDLAMALLAL